MRQAFLQTSCLRSVVLLLPSSGTTRIPQWSIRNYCRSTNLLNEVLHFILQAPPLEFDSDQLVGTHVWAVFLGRELLLQKQKKTVDNRAFWAFFFSPPLTSEPSILSHVEQRVKLLNSWTEIWGIKQNGHTENNNNNNKRWNSNVIQDFKPDYDLERVPTYIISP